MRTIDRTNQFKRDYKRELKGQHRATLEGDLVKVLKVPGSDVPLAERYRDHALTGEWKDSRDCHIKPDLVLIYQKPNDKVLQLVRLGSHSELGL
ncbi:MAG: type II toxin-antitoxin system YafQ family toxin [Gammaproteobacteria bacterium]|nr:type II toxin-antitoxin system YafQ family toxin [Gammaproteobacteria bacterium]